MHYVWKASMRHYVCVEVMDRNGNYLSISYNSSDLLDTLTDTLGRVLTVNYDSSNYPTSITQTWKGSNGAGTDTTHTWATFDYTNVSVSTSFGSMTVIGPANSTTVKSLEKITYSDGSFTKFEYNGYVQVKKISQHAPDSTTLSPHVLNYISTNLDSISGTQTDCPRLGEQRSWVENFNLDGYGVPQEVVTTNSVTTGATYSLPNSITGSATRIDTAMTGHPDGLYTRTYVGSSGYTEGLPLATEDCTGTNCATRLRWTWTDWTQDNTSATYITNPRVVESRVGDGTNTKRTTIDYGTNAYGLPEKTKVYDTDLTTVLKTQVSVYNLTSTYTNLRIIGLPSESYLWQGADSTGTLMSKVTYTYDEGNLTGTDPVQNISPTQHDNTNYSSSYVTGRGLLTTVTRWDATAPTTSGSAVSSTMKYNTAGAVVSKMDPLSHTVKIAYADNFNSSPGVSTYAYPTTLTDQAGNSSTVKYRYDIGANVEAASPAPGSLTYGKTSKREYSDTTAMLLKDSVYVNTTLKYYTRYVVPSTDNGVQRMSYTTVIDTDADGADPDDEVLTETWLDGAGRTRRTRTEHPGSTGGWAATQTEYDVLGRVYRTSVPTEVSVSGPTWTPAGDDSTRGWVWNYSYYDWKGRPTRTIPSDSTGSDGKDTLISYAGCGCAGGQVTTIQGPSVPRDDTTGNARRKQMIYEDILGRNVKTEIYGWDGSTVYTTTVNTYNGRDQVTLSRQYAGTTSASTYQDTTTTFDGHGRMATQHVPANATSTNTAWTYNADDSVASVTDPRGDVSSFTYESRGLITQKAYTPHSGGMDSPTVDYTYDNLGNRLTMDTDGISNVTYVYDELSRLTSETTDFDDLSSNYSLTYTYELGGALKSLTDPFSAVISYTNNKIGNPTAVTGTGFSNTTYASSISYRAFGGLKQMTYGSSDGSVVSYSYDNKLQPSSYQSTSSVLSGGYVRKADYSYAADGMISSVDNVVDAPFDETYKYDHAARLTASESGLVTNDASAVVPAHQQTIGYDPFSNVTSRSTGVWGATSSFAASYTNDRKTGGTEIFDASGNVIDTTGGLYNYDRWTFDAAGRISDQASRKYQGGSVIFDQQQSVTQSNDGEGQVVKRYEHRAFTATPPGTTTTANETLYYIRSAVLGGSLITEIDNSPAKNKTHVYLGGIEIAVQLAATSENVWRHRDPVTGNMKSVNQDGSIHDFFDAEYNAEREPLGGAIPTSDPADMVLSIPQSYQGGGTVLAKPEYNCVVDGVLQDKSQRCERAMLSNSAWIDWKNTNSEGAGNAGVIMLPFWNPNSGRPIPVDHNDPSHSFGDGGNWEFFQIHPNNTDENREAWSRAARRLTVDETDTLRLSVGDALRRRDGCERYISDLINRVALDTGAAVQSTDMLFWFDFVAKSRGDDPEIDGGLWGYTVWAPAANANNGWKRNGENKGFGAIFVPFSNYGSDSISRMAYLATAGLGGITAIHELMHVALYGVVGRWAAGDDRDFANAAAELAGQPRPPDYADYSGYWGERLRQACGFDSHLTHKMTNYPLYK